MVATVGTNYKNLEIWISFFNWTLKWKITNLKVWEDSKIKDEDWNYNFKEILNIIIKNHKYKRKIKTIEFKNSKIITNLKENEDKNFQREIEK